MRRVVDNVICTAPSTSLLASKAAAAVWYMDVTGHSKSTRWGYCKATKGDYDQIRYFETKSRDKWNYDRIDEEVNQKSEFRDKTNRDSFFEGPRQDNSYMNEGKHGTPKGYRLHDYFEEYTKPGVNRKVAAALAVREVWKNNDKTNYGAEHWTMERPGFRSVPKEMLNRTTFYGHCGTWFDNSHRVWANHRSRVWVPHWPPPGYKMQRMSCKKEYMFGVEEPSLVAEMERYGWYRSWSENNARYGWRELLAFWTNMVGLVWSCRNHNEISVMNAVHNGMMYPGRHFIRTNGTPKNWETGCFWFQRDLKDFPVYCRRWSAAFQVWKNGHIDRLAKQERAAAFAKL